MADSNHPQSNPPEKAFCAVAQRGTESTQGGSIGADSGALPSNTAPANYTEWLSGTHILRSAVDSLYVSYKGALFEESEMALQQAKDLAQSENPLEQSLAVMEIVNHRFEVADRGKGKFPFVLKDNWFHIQLSRRTSKRMPMAYVQISSELLTFESIDEVMRQLTDVITELGDLSDVPNVSRVDLCVDFTTNYRLQDFKERDFVCKAKAKTRRFFGEAFTGYSFGEGGVLSARLYNKTEELKHSKKEYMLGVWRAGGWDGSQNVWRLEFEIKREVLRECGVMTIGELQRAIAGLWHYAMYDWCRLTVPNADHPSNVSRWPTHPLWAYLADMAWNAPAVRILKRVRKTRAPTDQYLFVNGLAGLTSFMARERISDPQEGMNRYMIYAQLFHAKREPDNPSAIDDYIQAKVGQKERKYNTGGGRDEPAILVDPETGEVL